MLPFHVALAVLLGAALLLDAILHLANAVWIGRWLGIRGVLLILGSFGHSLRKRKIIVSGAWRPQIRRLRRSVADWSASSTA